MADYTVLTEEQRETIRVGLGNILVTIIAYNKGATLSPVEIANDFISFQRYVGEECKTYEDKLNAIKQKRNEIVYTLKLTIDNFNVGIPSDLV